MTTKPSVKKVFDGQRGLVARSSVHLSEVDRVEGRANVADEVVRERVGDAAAIELHEDEEKPAPLSPDRESATNMQTGRTRRSNWRRTRLASASVNSTSPW